MSKLQPRTRTRLTQAYLDGLKPGERRRWIYDDKEPALGVTLHPTGKITYFARVRANGTTKRAGIENGTYPSMTIETARAEARRLVNENAATGDVVSARRQKRTKDKLAGTTVSDAVDRFCNEKRRKVRGEKLALKESTKADYRWKIGRLLCDHYDGPIASVNYDLLLRREKLLTPTIAAGGMRSLSSVWNWLQLRKDYQEWLPSNPVAEYRKREDGLHKPRAKNSRLKPADFEAFLTTVEEFDPIPRQAILWLILTGNRAGECTGLEWEHIDWRDGTYALIDPKNRYDATLPIPASLLTPLRQRRGTGRVFPVELRHHMQAISKAVGYHLTAHDLRRTHRGLCDATISAVSAKRLQNRAMQSVDDEYVGDSANLHEEIAKVEREFYRRAGKPLENVQHLEAV